MPVPKYLLPEHMQDKEKIQRMVDKIIKEMIIDEDNPSLINLNVNSSYARIYSSCSEPGVIITDPIATLNSGVRRSAKMEYIEDELPPYNIAIRSTVDYLNKKESFYDLILGFCDVEFSTSMYRSLYVEKWLNEQELVAKLLRDGYDYQNLYDPNCDTSVYYFMEDIDLDFSSMTDDDEYYPFGWWDFFEYLNKRGIKLPSFEMLDRFY